MYRWKQFLRLLQVSDHETLTKLAAEVGLDKEAVRQMLASDEMADAVRADEQEARRIGVTGVPFYLINKKYALTGAQPTEIFVQALNQVIAEDEEAEG